MGISDLENTARETKQKQRKAELISELSDLEKDEEESEGRQPTEYEKGAKVIVDKMHNPQNQHDRQIHTNIPKNILPNVMMMGAIEGGLRKLMYGSRVVGNKKDNIVTIYRKDETGNEFIYKKMTYTAYRRGLFFADAMQEVTGNLEELLMSHDGWRSNQGEREIGSLVNSENMRLQNQGYIGDIRKGIKKLVG